MKWNLMTNNILFALLLLLSSFATLEASRNTIVKIDKFSRGGLVCRSFEIIEPTEIEIYAIGAGESGKNNLSSYCWIIESGKFEPVWVMTQNNTEKMRSNEHLRVYDSYLELEDGKYEVYYYTGGHFNLSGLNISLDNVEINFDKIGEWVKELIDKAEDSEGTIEFDESDDLSDFIIQIDEDLLTDVLDNLMLEITAPVGYFAKRRCGNKSDLTIAEILEPDHNSYTSVGFTLKKSLSVEITAIGEYSKYDNAFADHAWLIDAGSRERIWIMDENNTQYFGGSSKNRGFNDDIYINAGDYILYYATDDSHCYDDWNSSPPYNPLDYGVRIKARKISDLKETSSYRDEYDRKAIIAITGLDNNNCDMKYFTVEDDCDVRLYAIGEYDYSCDQFSDYSWLEKIGDTKPYWEMTDRNCNYAGGAKKNRYFDDVVHLDKGEYTLYYLTDGSHNYGDWNLAPPYDQYNYGITMYSHTQEASKASIDVHPKSKNPSLFARIICVGDDVEESRYFTIDKAQRVNIIALGEGEQGRMFDYGWIEDVDNQEVVWEMTYRRTAHGGGAAKNRIIDDDIMLAAGNYRVYFVTDDSHSFEKFNATKPSSPHLWGITIVSEK